MIFTARTIRADGNGEDDSAWSIELHGVASTGQQRRGLGTVEVPGGTPVREVDVAGFFGRSRQRGGRNWFGLRQWLALADCCDTVSWVRLGGALALRPIVKCGSRLNLFPIVTQCCFLVLAAVAAAALP